MQFEPDALHASINRLLARNATAAYLTHYGRVENLPSLALDLHALIDAFVALALAATDIERLKSAMGDLLMSRLRAHGCRLDEAVCRDLLANDLELNSQGLLVWRDREPR